MGSPLHSRPVFPAPATQNTPLRNRILFLSAVWIIALIPLFFWHGPWFGRPLSDQQIDSYLHDQNPRHVEHAMVQLGERMGRRDQTVEVWYPTLVALADSSDEDIRSTDAQIMAEDSRQPAFHDALRRMLHDGSAAVRNQAALSLVRFSDPLGHDQIVSILQPIIVTAPTDGRILEIAKAGANVSRDENVARLDCNGRAVEIHAAIAGRIHTVLGHPGENISGNAGLLTMYASTDDLWKALRALAIIGRPDDLPAVESWTGLSPNIPERLRQQAMLTDKLIRERK